MEFLRLFAVVFFVLLVIYFLFKSFWLIVIALAIAGIVYWLKKEGKFRSG